MVTPLDYTAQRFSAASFRLCSTKRIVIVVIEREHTVPLITNRDALRMTASTPHIEDAGIFISISRSYGLFIGADPLVPTRLGLHNDRGRAFHSMTRHCRVAPATGTRNFSAPRFPKVPPAADARSVSLWIPSSDELVAWVPTFTSPATRCGRTDTKDPRRL